MRAVWAVPVRAYSPTLCRLLRAAEVARGGGGSSARGGRPAPAYASPTTPAAAGMPLPLGGGETLLPVLTADDVLPAGDGGPDRCASKFPASASAHAVRAAAAVTVTTGAAATFLAMAKTQPFV
jgi:hypothetical protein